MAPQDRSKGKARRVRLLVLLVALAIAVGAWQWQRRQLAVAARSALAQGQEALDRQDRTAAERAFRRALEIDPHLAGAHTQLGRLAVVRGEHETAILHFAAAAQADPHNAEAVSDLAIARLESGDWAEAVRTFQQALQIAPDFVQALRGLGEAYRRGQRWDEAVAALEKALRAQPEDAQTLSILGLTLAQRGRLPADPHRALELLAAARKRGMPEAQVRYGEGLAYLAQGRASAAVRALEATAHGEPGDDQALYHLGQAYRRAGRPTEAARVLAEHSARSERRRQLRSLRERVATQPGDAGARRRLAEACVGTGEYREALRHLLALQTAGADDPALYDLFARAWDGLGLKVPASQARQLAAQRRAATDKVTR